jgi:hypothetical protein
LGGPLPPRRITGLCPSCCRLLTMPVNVDSVWRGCGFQAEY